MTRLGQPFAVNPSRYLAALGLLSLLYIIVPSRTPQIWITEPRVLLLIVLVALLPVQLPPPGRLKQAIILGIVFLCLVSLVGLGRYAYLYNRQAQIWAGQMAALAPARTVLTLRAKTSPYISRPTLLGVFNRFYTGEYFSTAYNLEAGGFASRTFNNGPIRPRSAILIPAYNWPGFQDTRYVADHCERLHQTYEAVLFWGPRHGQVETQLDSCFVAGPQWSNMGIWYKTNLTETTHLKKGD